MIGNSEDMINISNNINPSGELTHQNSQNQNRTSQNPQTTTQIRTLPAAQNNKSESSNSEVFNKMTEFIRNDSYFAKMRKSAHILLYIETELTTF